MKALTSIFILALSLSSFADDIQGPTFTCIQESGMTYRIQILYPEHDGAASATIYVSDEHNDEEILDEYFSVDVDQYSDKRTSISIVSFDSDFTIGLDSRSDRPLVGTIYPNGDGKGIQFKSCFISSI